MGNGVEVDDDTKEWRADRIVGSDQSQGAVMVAVDGRDRGLGNKLGESILARKSVTLIWRMILVTS